MKEKIAALFKGIACLVAFNIGIALTGYAIINMMYSVYGLLMMINGLLVIIASVAWGGNIYRGLTDDD